MSPIQEARLALELPMLEESSVISPKSQRPKSKCSFTFLGDADGTTSHADSQSIYTCIYEVLGLRSSDYIASNDLQTGVLLLDVFDHIDLEDGVSLGRVLEQEEGNTSYTMIWQSPH